MPKIENWFKKKVYDQDLNEYTIICGTVHDYPNLGDVRSITTSPIIEICDGYVKTKNSTYELGQEYVIPESNSRYFLLKKGSPAYHKTGNISRDYFEAELIVVHNEDDEFYIGNFAEGYGFVDIKFRKTDCREATEQEYRMCMVGRMEEIKF
jgi:hypothetical protein